MDIFIYRFSQLLWNSAIKVDNVAKNVGYINIKAILFQILTNTINPFDSIRQPVYKAYTRVLHRAANTPQYIL